MAVPVGCNWGLEENLPQGAWSSWDPPVSPGHKIAQLGPFTIYLMIQLGSLATWPKDHSHDDCKPILLALAKERVPGHCQRYFKQKGLSKGMVAVPKTTEKIDRITCLPQTA